MIDVQKLLQDLGIEEVNSGVCTGTKWYKAHGKELVSYSPIDGKPIAKVTQATKDDYEMVVQKAQVAFKEWRMMPAPRRGEIVRQIGDALRAKKSELGALVALEMGKIKIEGEGEVQEMIDICDFAVGLSRQLYGLTIHSERPYHRMYEQWHPLGIVGTITAFNFPVAVWAWNTALLMACGDVTIWKPSSKTPLAAIAVQKIVQPILEANDLPEGILNLTIGSGREVGETMINDTRVPLISATGSTRMGKRIGAVVGERLGKTILELGGNNAVLVMEDANIDMALRAVLFGAVGTAGQRCTSTRRVLLHEKIYDEFLSRLQKSYAQVKIGNPLEEGTLMGPLVDKGAVDTYLEAIEMIKKQGGKILCGGKAVEGEGFYVEPTIVECTHDLPLVQDETFAPILYVIKIKDIDEAIELHNSVQQGLSSTIITNNMQYSEQFLSHKGSDCGIANVNIGTSGAEIGGAFGGEKETGGGRESGSDAWKAYMRRQTNTINWGKDLPLAQGITFGD